MLWKNDKFIHVYRKFSVHEKVIAKKNELFKFSGDI